MGTVFGKMVTLSHSCFAADKLSCLPRVCDPWTKIRAPAVVTGV